MENSVKIIDKHNMIADKDCTDYRVGDKTVKQFTR
jgi:hypothetical protein